MKTLIIITTLLAVCSFKASDTKEIISRIPKTSIPFECTRTTPGARPITAIYPTGRELPQYIYDDITLSHKTSFKNYNSIFKRFEWPKTTFEVLAIRIGVSDPELGVLATLTQDGELIDYIEAEMLFYRDKPLYIMQYRIDKDATIIVTRSNKRATLFNQGVRGRVLYMEAEIATGDMLLVAKNNYFWAEEYDNIDFIANGDIAVVRRISNFTHLYGFRFADVTLEFPDYGTEIDAKIILDALYTDTPALTREQNNMLYQQVMEDYADIPRKSEKFKRLKKDPYFNALQVKFAYSITCHKAQGGQWKNVFIDMGYLPEEAYRNVDFYRWLYTSFTRSYGKIYLINPPLETD